MSKKYTKQQVLEALKQAIKLDGTIQFECSKDSLRKHVSNLRKDGYNISVEKGVYYLVDKTLEKPIEEAPGSKIPQSESIDFEFKKLVVNLNTRVLKLEDTITMLNDNIKIQQMYIDNISSNQRKFPWFDGIVYMILWFVAYIAIILLIK